VVASLIALGALVLSGCSIPLANLPWVGEPANTPPPPENPRAYLPVHDVPPPRDQTVLTDEQQTKLKKDLQTARDKQNAEAGVLAKSAGK
jgi:hypothetical protein